MIIKILGAIICYQFIEILFNSSRIFI